VLQGTSNRAATRRINSFLLHTEKNHVKTVPSPGGHTSTPEFPDTKQEYHPLGNIENELLLCDLSGDAIVCRHIQKLI
jgi:hypothetical protein